MLTLELTINYVMTNYGPKFVPDGGIIFLGNLFGGIARIPSGPFIILRVYHNNIAARILVNMIQLNMDCCGATAYKDWLSLNWRMYEVSNDEDSIEEDNIDAVPYSCCNKATAMACGHYDLRTYGTCSIHRNGCGSIVRRWTKDYFWLLFTLYLTNVTLEVLLLVIFYSEQKKSKTKMGKKEKGADEMVAEYLRIEESPWEGMSNCSKGSSVSSQCSNRSASPEESEDSDLDESSLNDETPELTSSHRQPEDMRIGSEKTESFKDSLEEIVSNHYVERNITEDS